MKCSLRRQNRIAMIYCRNTFLGGHYQLMTRKRWTFSQDRSDYCDIGLYFFIWFYFYWRSIPNWLGGGQLGKAKNRSACKKCILSFIKLPQYLNQNDHSALTLSHPLTFHPSCLAIWQTHGQHSFLISVKYLIQLTSACWSAPFSSAAFLQIV